MCISSRTDNIYEDEGHVSPSRQPEIVEALQSEMGDNIAESNENVTSSLYEVGKLVKTFHFQSHWF